MARPKSEIPRWIPIDMQKLFSLQATMKDDNSFGAFCRKAVMDFCSGCVADDVNDLVRERFNYALKRMQSRQEIDARKYKNKQGALSGNANDDSKAPPPCTILAEARNDQVPGSVDADTRKDSEEKLQRESVTLDNLATSTEPKVVKVKQSYGEFHNVKLTDEEGAKLREAYGADLAIAINILDGYIENNGKAAKRYKSHYSVLRRGNWVWEKVKNTKTAEKRLESVSRGARNFKAEEREAMARFIRGESVNHDSKLNDVELSREELRQLYG